MGDSLEHAPRQKHFFVDRNSDSLCRTPLEQIVFAARWSSPTVLSVFYLRSLSYFAENLYALAPLVVFNTNIQLPEDLREVYHKVAPTPVVCGHLSWVLAFVVTFSGAVSGDITYPYFFVLISNFHIVLHSGLGVLHNKSAHGVCFLRMQAFVKSRYYSGANKPKYCLLDPL